MRSHHNPRKRKRTVLPNDLTFSLVGSHSGSHEVGLSMFLKSMGGRIHSGVDWVAYSGAMAARKVFVVLLYTGVLATSAYVIFRLAAPDVDITGLTQLRGGQ